MEENTYKYPKRNCKLVKLIDSTPPLITTNSFSALTPEENNEERDEGTINENASEENTQKEKLQDEKLDLMLLNKTHLKANSIQYTKLHNLSNRSYKKWRKRHYHPSQK